MAQAVLPTDLPGRLARLRDLGVAIWLDDLSRPLIHEGRLAALVRDRGVVGVTSNPTIFAAALAGGDAYDAQVGELAAAGVSLDEAVLTITTDDVRDACDVLAELHRGSGGVDGRVSIEVDPRLARDTDATLAMARRLWTTVDRPNLFIKIPATREGLPAISSALAEGISVNVTLIFSLDRYRAVMDAHAHGLEQALAAGRDVSALASVASFFVSRVDTAVDRRLDEIGTEQAAALRGTAAIANARLAHREWVDVLAGDRWRRIAAHGGLPQRPLWASTGVKDPAYSDTRYVDQLVARNTVNTMPGATLEAVADHGEVTGETISAYDEAAAHLTALGEVGVDLAGITDALEVEGVQKFEASWAELLTTVGDALRAAGSPGLG